MSDQRSRNGPTDPGAARLGDAGRAGGSEPADARAPTDPATAPLDEPPDDEVERELPEDPEIERESAVPERAARGSVEQAVDEGGVERESIDDDTLGRDSVESLPDPVPQLDQVDATYEP